jgi:RNase H-fold protein (predicted Holliday junction resolvase)
VAAERHLVGQGVRREKRRTVVDQLAATLILETFLARRRGG